MVADLLLLGEGVAFALSSRDMHQNGPFDIAHQLKDIAQFAHVVAIDGAHIGKAQLLEDDANFVVSHRRQELDAVFHALKFGWEGWADEGKIANLLGQGLV